MTKKIIKIDENKCVGCSLCTTACQEGAIVMVNGKAKLLYADYCDGLGNCLPVCPVKAISIEEQDGETLACGCPGTHAKQIERTSPTEHSPKAYTETHLNQWPIQIKLVPQNAAYFNNAHLLVAADCTAYAYGNFHHNYMKNRITIIGCPKLDDLDYTEKLTNIITTNEIKTVIIVRMEVPCCAGLENAVKNALSNSGKMIPWQIVTISTDGKILEI
jgi:ferredoxin